MTITMADSGKAPSPLEFVKFCADQDVLKFGEFRLKSGRKSPYFFNAGLFTSGTAVKKLGEFYAGALVESGIEFDHLFGPAYKGIPLATATSIGLSSLFNRDVEYTFNRKVAKDHGEGGNLVGASMKGKKVVIVDDVITAGTAIRESLEILSKEGCTVAGVLVAMDRQEKAPDSELSAIQGVEKEYGFPVASIIKLADIVKHLEASGDAYTGPLEALRKYRDEYGVIGN
ncbi:unnamed protein product [Amoebophrya sp. A25]|nr:unnamed protein product [Amoebophrya sp. A25]|eukprot:GSA25T00022987001.1